MSLAAVEPAGLQFWVHDRDTGKTEASFFDSKRQWSAMADDAAPGTGAPAPRVLGAESCGGDRAAPL